MQQQMSEHFDNQPFGEFVLLFKSFDRRAACKIIRQGWICGQIWPAGADREYRARQVR
jgi:hypothetical protein